MRYPAVLLIPIAIVGVSLFVVDEPGQKQPAHAPVNPAPDLDPDLVSVPVPVNSVPVPVPVPDSVRPHEL